jgi:hypothetical protein
MNDELKPLLQISAVLLLENFSSFVKAVPHVLAQC